MWDIIVAILVFLLALWAITQLGMSLWHLLWVVIIIALIVWLLRSRQGTGTL